MSEKKSPYEETEETVAEKAIDTTLAETEEVKENNENVVEDTTLLETKKEEEGEVTYLWEPNAFSKEQANAVRASASLIPNAKAKKEDDNVNPEDVIHTVRGTAKSVYAALERMSTDILDEEDRTSWIKKITTAQQRYMLSNDQLVEAVIRKGSCWVNMVNFGTKEEPSYKGMVSDKRGLNPMNANDKTAPAIVRALSSMGLGIPNYVPLYHTGIWVKLRTPTAVELIRLDELLTMEKVRYGAQTRGDIFSNESVIIRKHVVDFILDHIEWTNAPELDKDYLRKTIKVMDLDALMLGIMQNRYPEGYHYVQTCTVNPNKCSHVVEGLIDLRELRWDDEAALTEKQLKLMNNPRRRITHEELEVYQAEFATSASARICFDMGKGRLIGADEDTLTNGIAINIEIPSLEKDEDYGVKWINDLVRNAEDIFREKHSEEQRRIRMEEEVLVSSAKAFGAWVKSIDVYEGGLVIQTLDDSDDIDIMLKHISSEDRLASTFTALIREYVTKNIVTVIGIMNYECPNCGGKHDTPEGNHYMILPIDVLYTFFTLVQSSVKRSIRQNSI